MLDNSFMSMVGSYDTLFISDVAFPIASHVYVHSPFSCVVAGQGGIRGVCKRTDGNTDREQEMTSNPTVASGTSCKCVFFYGRERGRW